MQIAEHAGTVGAGILSEDEQRVAMFEIFKIDRAFADADAVGQRNARRLMAHIGAVREIIGAEKPAERLIEEGRLVRSTARCVKLDTLGVEASQFGGDVADRFVPRDRLIFVSLRIVTHGMGEAADILNVMIGPGHEFFDRMFGEELRRRALMRGFPGDGLGAILAIFECMWMSWVGPGATGAIEAIRLVHQ